jgi:transcriptional regulator with PAS, ATPase and Fis domain
VVERLADALRAAGFSVEWSLASFPADGLNPDELMAKAGRGVQTTGGGSAASIVIGVDPRLQESIARIAASQLSVLITGETGSGKERTAELVHELSRRAGRPFLKLNCAALSESLLESELFGHERGAFTGAVAAKPGLLQTADSGTVFLDEIGELSPAIQAKLLRVIEERQVMRLGGLKPLGIDVRFVSATNRNLEDEIARGTFRIDLYYRIAGAQLWVPPLRERLDELRTLTQTLIAAACAREGREPLTLSDESLEMMRRYPWPGNIRELRNVIDRAVLLANGGVITPAHLPVEKLLASFAARRASQSGPTAQSQTRSGARAGQSTSRTGSRREPPLEGHTPAPREATPRTPSPRDLKQSIRELERQRIREALEQAAGNQTRAAQALGISRRTLVSRLGELGFPRPRKRRAD